MSSSSVFSFPTPNRVLQPNLHYGDGAAAALEKLQSTSVRVLEGASLTGYDGGGTAVSLSTAARADLDPWWKAPVTEGETPGIVWMTLHLFAPTTESLEITTLTKLIVVTMESSEEGVPHLDMAFDLDDRALHLRALDSLVRTGRLLLVREQEWTDEGDMGDSSTSALALIIPEEAQREVSLTMKLLPQITDLAHKIVAAERERLRFCHPAAYVGVN